jgi:carboxyl-terminal processing protease
MMKQTHLDNGSAPGWRCSTVALLLMLTACAGRADNDAYMAIASPTSLSEQVFTVGYERIAEYYVDPVPMGELVIVGLTGLMTLDPRLTITAIRGQSLIEIHIDYDGETVAAVSLPPPQDARAWGRMTEKVLRQARMHSPLLNNTELSAIHAAIMRRATSLLDPYSRYATPSRAAEERVNREGYSGIGVGLLDGPNGPVVQTVLQASPAAAAGLRAGDRITHIGAHATVGLDANSTARLLRGREGKRVSVAYQRGEQAPQWLRLYRRRLIENTVAFQFSDGVGIITVSRFNQSTYQNVGASVADLVSFGPRLRGLVLDLRDNPGGLLYQAVKTADLFIDTGTIIQTQGRHPDSRMLYKAHAGDMANALPLVVLINGQSASAAELVAMALRDSDRAVVVGSLSFGKGLLQTVTDLPNGGTLFVSWSRIVSPEGYPLHGNGVMPTVCATASNNAENADPIPATEAISIARVLDLARTDGQLAPVAHTRSSLTAMAMGIGACTTPPTDAASGLEIAKKLIMEPALYRRAQRLQRVNLASEAAGPRLFGE